VFTLSFARPARWILIALLAAATGFAAYDFAIAADPVGAQPEGKDSAVAKLELKPGTHDFGEVIVTLASAPLTVTATNKSKSAQITFASIVASPPFAIQSDRCSNAPLNAGNSCEVMVVFHPAASGKVKDKKGLTFTDSAKKSPQHVELEGRGIIGATPTPTFTATATVTATPTITATTITATPVTATPTVSATPTCTIRATSTTTATVTPGATPTPAPQSGDFLIAGGDTGGTVGVDPVAGGANSTNGAQVFNSSTSAFEAVGSMNTGREAAAAVALENNKILVVGGEQCFPATFGSASGFECTALNTAEIYDPATQRFTMAGLGSCGTMTTARAGATATLIYDTQDSTYLDGRILIVGGTSGSSFVSGAAPPPGSGAPTGQVAQNTAEIYDPASDTFTPLAATVPVPSVCGAGQTAPCGLVNHAATLIGATAGMDQGQILIAGGDLVSPLVESTNLAFIFHPHTQSFTTAAPMSTARELFSLTPVSPVPLIQGFTTVLAAGGVSAASNVCSTAGDMLVTTNNTGETYNPTNNTWSAVTNNMSVNRAAHSATYLETGALLGETLMAGGIDFEAGSFPSTCVASTSLTMTTTASADLYDPATDAFAATGSLNQARGAQAFGLEGSNSSPATSLQAIVVGGECAAGTSAAYVVGTAAAASSCDANAEIDYSEIFDESTQTWSLGPSAPASGVLPSSGPVSSSLTTWDFNTNI